MKKKYIAPQIAIAHLASQNVICTSGGEQGEFIVDKETPTTDVWAPTRSAGLTPASSEAYNSLEH